MLLNALAAMPRAPHLMTHRMLKNHEIVGKNFNGGGAWKLVLAGGKTQFLQEKSLIVSSIVECLFQNLSSSAALVPWHSVGCPTISRLHWEISISKSSDYHPAHHKFSIFACFIFYIGTVYFFGKFLGQYFLPDCVEDAVGRPPFLISGPLTLSTRAPAHLPSPSASD